MNLNTTVMESKSDETYAFLAQFSTPAAVYQAAEKVRDAGFSCWDVHTPCPIHGMDKAMGLKRSKLPRCTFLGGLTGFCTGFIMVWFMNGFDYPLIVGGKPFFSPIFPFPVFYELTILFAAFGTFFGMFLFNKLPQHYHSVFNSPAFYRASDDAFFIVIEAKDPLFNKTKTEAFLKSLGPDEVSLVHL
jgi:hypothetical protein